MYVRDGKYDGCIETDYRRAFSDAIEPEGEGPRSLDFQTPPLSPEFAAKLAELVPGYNAYDGALFAHYIRNDDAIGAVRMGRESSPVAYIWYSGLQPNVNELARILNADETSVEDDGWCRFWWD